MAINPKLVATAAMFAIEVGSAMMEHKKKSDEAKKETTKAKEVFDGLTTEQKEVLLSSTKLTEKEFEKALNEPETLAALADRMVSLETKNKQNKATKVPDLFEGEIAGTIGNKTNIMGK